jgi:hypothetical protein
MKTTIIGIFLAISLSLLHPFDLSAQVTSYTKVNAPSSTRHLLKKTDNASTSVTFHSFKSECKAASELIQQNYPELSKFSFDVNGKLTHTFFHHNGERMHVVINQKNRIALEITELKKSNYNEQISKEVLQQYPESNILVMKHINTLQDSWYEVLLDYKGEKHQLNIIAYYAINP